MGPLVSGPLGGAVSGPPTRLPKLPLGTTPSIPQGPRGAHTTTRQPPQPPWKKGTLSRQIGGYKKGLMTAQLPQR